MKRTIYKVIIDSVSRTFVVDRQNWHQLGYMSFETESRHRALLYVHSLGKHASGENSTGCDFYHYLVARRLEENIRSPQVSCLKQFSTRNRMRQIAEAESQKCFFYRQICWRMSYLCNSFLAKCRLASLMPPIETWNPFMSRRSPVEFNWSIYSHHRANTGQTFPFL